MRLGELPGKGLQNLRGRILTIAFCLRICTR
jgi:hypothetical protein